VKFAIDVARFVLWIVWIMLIARIVLSFVFSFARDWRPAGVPALLVESVYTVTDPLIKPLRRVIPPISIGAIRFDVAFLIVFIAVMALQQLLTELSKHVP
jgi:YggT family protein